MQDAAMSAPEFALQSVKLQRFKAAFDPEPIELRPLSVLIGRNGSGKSTLLEALQWLDTAMRFDARVASDRYFGVRDLINLRGDASWFGLRLVLSRRDAAGPDSTVSYEVIVEAESDGGTPRIAEERLWVGKPAPANFYIKTDSKTGQRTFCAREMGRPIPFSGPERLALSHGASPLENSLKAFFRDWVFLRLSPSRLARGSPARRKSFEPMLDEEGQNLPALLHELSPAQRRDLVERVQQVLPGMRDVRVDEPGSRDTNVNYALLERMPYKGRAGERDFPIPSWMLSEGTRRITALFALLVHEPPPSLLCIEEVENGLDPKTTLLVLKELQSAADQGTQVLVTTHNPWLLDHVPLDDIFEARRVRGNTVYGRFADREAIRAYAADVPPGTRFVNEAE